MNLKNKTSVLIVGAGPSGLAMALWLRKKEIPFRIIDKRVFSNDTARASVIQASTLEFYHQLGIVGEIIAAGDLVPEMSIKCKNRVSVSIRLGDTGESVSPYPQLLFLPQQVHEKILIKNLEKLNVVIERQTELLQFTQNKFQVEALIKGPQGEETITASYLCGCDGVNSLTRHLSGIKFSNTFYQQDFFIADVSTTTAMEHKGLQMNLSQRNFCITFPILKSNTVHIMGIVPIESENKSNLSFANVSDYVNECAALDIKKINWFSTYSANHRVASHFQHGRTFLVGDAAHTHSPIAGHGMNAGIGDAINLSWKLAAVLNGQAASKILTTYEAERKPLAELLQKTTDAAFSLFSSRTAFSSFFRGYILPVFFRIIKNIKPVLRFTFRLLSQTKKNYHESLLSEGVAGKARAGDRLPWLKIDGQDNYESLKTLDWHIHIYGKAEQTFSSVASFRGFRIYEFEWTKNAEAKGFLKDAFYLIRPDGHIALAGTRQNPHLLKKYLNDWDLDHSQNLKKRVTTPERDLISFF